MLSRKMMIANPCLVLCPLTLPELDDKRSDYLYPHAADVLPPLRVLQVLAQVANGGLFPMPPQQVSQLLIASRPPLWQSTLTNAPSDVGDTVSWRARSRA